MVDKAIISNMAAMTAKYGALQGLPPSRRLFKQ